MFKMNKKRNGITSIWIVEKRISRVYFIIESMITSTIQLSYLSSQTEYGCSLGEYVDINYINGYNIQMFPLKNQSI